ncbi:MAG: GrpB family protein [Spirochaetota bacterium]
MEDTIIIVPYNPKWIERYNDEKSKLMELFKPYKVHIEHIGSTSVVNLSAKPIVDIMLGADSLSIIENKIKDLEQIGYIYKPDFESIIPERRFFVKYLNDVKSFHLHCVKFGGEFWNDKLLFRDYLRNHPEIAKKYELLKKELATKYKYDRPTYTESKSDFILHIVEKAKKEFS